MEFCMFCEKELESSKNKEYSMLCSCTLCGHYERPSLFNGLDLNKGEKRKISSWISEQNVIFKETPSIDEEKIEVILSQREKSIQEKLECIVKTLKREDDISLEKFNHCYVDSDELHLIFEKLENQGYIQYEQNIGHSSYTLTFDGQYYQEQLATTNQNSKQVFVAFHFTEELQKMFDSTIRDTIEDMDLSYSRVSSSSTRTDVNINDEIISLIKSSKIVISDFTGQRNSVYFEAGFAMGLKIPVIWTCKEDDKEKVAFDTRQYPHIFWSDEQDLAEKLKFRIKTLL